MTLDPRQLNSDCYAAMAEWYGIESVLGRLAEDDGLAHDLATLIGVAQVAVDQLARLIETTGALTSDVEVEVGKHGPFVRVSVEVGNDSAFIVVCPETEQGNPIVEMSRSVLTMVDQMRRDQTPRDLSPVRRQTSQDEAYRAEMIDRFTDRERL